MTCIIGLQHEGRVYIGGDTLATFGWEAAQLSDGKVFRSGDFIIGVAGDIRFLDLVRYAFDTPVDPNKIYDMRYMVRDFVPALRTLLKDSGAMGKNDEKDSAGSHMLVGVCGQLYHITSSFSVTTRTEGFNCIGSGDAYALGAMEALKGLPPKERILRALEISAKFSIGVREPFTVLEA